MKNFVYVIYNTETRFFREINKIEDNEKKIRLIQPDKQREYRQLLVSINIIKQKLNAPPVIMVILVLHKVIIRMPIIKNNFMTY